MSRPVDAGNRVRDAVALALLTGGSALYAYATWGMTALAGNRIAWRPGAMLLTQRWEQFRYFSRAGLVVAGIGLAIGIWSAARHARKPASADASAGSTPTPDPMTPEPPAA